MAGTGDNTGEASKTQAHPVVPGDITSEHKND